MVYDFYVYDTNGAVIIHWQKFEAEDDDAAIARASELPELPGLSPRELWRDQQLMQCWEAPAGGHSG